jgi:plasmid stabilization system protein ParE
MVKRVVWSREAAQDKIDILKYWNWRNKSKNYSKKLNKLFNDAIDLVRDYPNLGRKTDYDDYKNILVKEYLIFYLESTNEIRIIAIWDERRNPDKIKVKLKI